MSEPFIFSSLARKALRTVGAVGQGVEMSANDLDIAFEAANDMLDGWAAQRLTVFQTLRKVFTGVANQGSTSNPYTIGIGGDLNVPRPIWIPEAAFQLTAPSPDLELPLRIYEDGEYASIGMKNLTASIANGLYFNGKFDTSGADVGLGEIFLYPVPDGTQTFQLVLYLPTALTAFADKAATEYTFPPGYAEALRYQLALRCAAELQKETSAEVRQLASDTFAVIQRNNVEIPSLTCHGSGLPGMSGASGLYDYRTDAGRG